MAAEKVTPEAINFMAQVRPGPHLPVADRGKVRRAAASPDGRRTTRRRVQNRFYRVHRGQRGVTTGISAARPRRPSRRWRPADAGQTDIWCARATSSRWRPSAGGVLVRTGQTEGSVDLARLAGCEPAGVICEVMNDDGTMARMPDLEIFGRKHNLQIVTIADLISYRLQKETLVRRAAITTLAHRVTRRFPAPSPTRTRWTTAAPGPGQGRHHSPTSRCWSACTPNA